jgi:phage terminase large subunit
VFVPQIRIPEKLVPVFTGEAMYRGAYGGRGSAKTRTFAKMAAVRGMMFAQAGLDGVIVCGREFMNSLDDSSLAEVKAAILEEPFLAEKYDVGEKYVRTKDGLISFAFIGLRHNLDSIKSKAKIRLLWVDEAEPVSESAWGKAIPTVREEDAEIWVTWNPERKKSATHKRFREDPPTDAKIVSMNWRDNPWFPTTLQKTRLDDKTKRPDQYNHVWEGDFVTAIEGAYYAPFLTRAKEQGRIGRVSFDPVMRVRVYVDIGGTGAKADAFSMWPAQFIGKEIRTRDYYEAQGQPLAAHIRWLHSKGYKPDVADIYLPHDGATNEKIIDASFQSAFQAAGYDVTVIPNQGKGAARMRVEAGRRVFDSIWFDEETTEHGRDALGWYHEKKSDDEREALLGPEHDWSSHGADAFGLMCVSYEEPIVEIEPNKSQVVSPDLADALEWIKPGLQRVFLASDHVGIYEPASEEDKDGAEQATDGINFYVMRRCEGYRVINDGIHDGLLHGNGIWKHYWDKSKQYKTETLTGLTQEEYDALLADDTMEKVLEKREYYVSADGKEVNGDDAK